MEQLIQDVELAATDAQTGLVEAHGVLASQVARAKRYAPEARKLALDEFGTLQAQLRDLQAALSPLLRCRKEYEGRVAAKRATAEVTRALDAAELAVAKCVGSRLTPGLALVTPMPEPFATASAAMAGSYRAAGATSCDGDER